MKSIFTIAGSLFYCLFLSQSKNSHSLLEKNATSVSASKVTDTDGDGIPDDLDRDDDNDGIPDAVECPATFYWTGPITYSPTDNKVATGTINGIGYTYTSSQPLGATGGIFNYGAFPASYGIPNSNPTIANTQMTHNTLTFASPMTDPTLVLHLSEVAASLYRLTSAIL